MIEVPDWNCCGATAYMSIDDRQAMVLSARNLALAEGQARDLVAVCSGCYVVLNKANHRFQDDPKLRDRVRFALKAGGMDYRARSACNTSSTSWSTTSARTRSGATSSSRSTGSRSPATTAADHAAYAGR
jgi:heterodisulfide reductase subunit B